jgi:hypothetical protein
MCAALISSWARRDRLTEAEIVALGLPPKSAVRLIEDTQARWAAKRPDGGRGRRHQRLVES